MAIVLAVEEDARASGESTDHARVAIHILMVI
jgi:hypothetical protein